MCGYSLAENKAEVQRLVFGWWRSLTQPVAQHLNVFGAAFIVSWLVGFKLSARVGQV